ncbi:hypothetical protein HOU02_gp194 [Caulobacter phage CcrBL9]|uniref:Uncharacterized protein n=1 Tax=Caulobacter phage CcrBL9 TaxID=2283270 RepID=A0A385ECC3_9CAUD|nr:hypothetical protein HOU02_gp194 [Caulobacter phage CcrBL9]AXQ69531.1 hypothetical protein CcrBL9_gp507 [Caulobacter phage CcrBL9]
MTGFVVTLLIAAIVYHVLIVRDACCEFEGEEGKQVFHGVTAGILVMLEIMAVGALWSGKL